MGEIATLSWQTGRWKYSKMRSFLVLLDFPRSGELVKYQTIDLSTFGKISSSRSQAFYVLCDFKIFWNWWRTSDIHLSCKIKLIWKFEYTLVPFSCEWPRYKDTLQLVSPPFSNAWGTLRLSNTWKMLSKLAHSRKGRSWRYKKRQDRKL